MKKSIIISLFFILLHSIGNAGDFIVEFVEENYRETNSPVSYSPVIYHSIQVRTDAGPKMLVLKGDDNYYRKWLRQYIAQGKQFIAQIPDDQDDLFISSSVFEMDAVNLHPFNLGLYRQGEKNFRAGKKPDAVEKKLYSSHVSDKIQSKIKKKGLLRKKADRKQAQLKKKNDKANQDKKKTVLKEKVEKKNKQNQVKSQKQAEQKQQYKAELKKRKREQEKFLAAVQARRMQNMKQRRENFEKSWQYLKQRLLADEKFRNMAFEVQNQEIERRRVELKQRYGF